MAVVTSCDDMPDLLAAADGLVLSTESEALPNIVMEGMAAGLPVVATDVGGIPELIEDRVNGFLVPARDPAALASAMSRVMAMTAVERQRLGASGRSLVKRRYDLGTVAARWLAVIDECVTAAPTRDVTNRLPLHVVAS